MANWDRTRLSVAKFSGVFRCTFAARTSFFLGCRASLALASSFVGDTLRYDSSSVSYIIHVVCVQLSRRVRKDRRRPKALLSLYSKRAAFPRRWLVTHFFHAKRFHMINVWGYRLASHPTQRCQRKLYRYSRRKVLIHDRSYMQLLELQGTPEDLLAVLRICGADVSVAFSRPYLCGSRRGSLLLYSAPHAGRDRRVLIAPVEFLWKPLEDPACTARFQQCFRICRELQLPKLSKCQTVFGPEVSCPSDQRRTLWLWVHPSAADAAESELRAAGQHADKERGRSRECGDSCQVPGIPRVEEVFHVSAGTQQSLTIKRVDDVAWFELTGPHAFALAALTLKTPSNRGTNSSDHGVNSDTSATQACVGSSLSCTVGTAPVLPAQPESACFAEKQVASQASLGCFSEPPESAWRAMVRTALTSGCSSPEPPGGAVLPLEVFLPPLLGPFPPRTRRLPGVPVCSNCLSESPKPPPSQPWWECPFRSCRLFEEASRQQAAETSSKWPWHPGRRSRKRQDVRKLLLRLKQKQQGRRSMEEHKARSDCSRPRAHSATRTGQERDFPDCLLAEGTASGSKRAHEADWMDVDARRVWEYADGKRRKQGIVPSLVPQPLAADPSSREELELSVDGGEEDLGEQVSVAELEARPEDALAPTVMPGAPSREISSASEDQLLPHRLPVEYDAGTNRDSTDRGRTHPSTQQDLCRLEGVGGSLRSAGMHPLSTRDRAVPCLVIWRSTGAAGKSVACGSFQKPHQLRHISSPSRGLSVLVQDRSSASCSSGIDLLLPASGGAARLFALLCRYGARPIGCRDRRKLLLESGEPDFPFDFPDTVAGTQFALCCAWQDDLRYRRKAPAKRVGFSSVAARCPFLPMWQLAGLPPRDRTCSRSSLDNQSRCCESSRRDTTPAAPETEERGPGVGEHVSVIHAQPQEGSLPPVPVKPVYPRSVCASLFALMPELAIKSKDPFHPRRYNSDAPLIPPLPPVPAFGAIPDFLAPISVMRPTRLDILRALLREQRQKTLRGWTACSFSSRRGMTFPSSAEVFLSELSRQLQATVQGAADCSSGQRPTGHGRRISKMPAVDETAEERRETSAGAGQGLSNKSVADQESLHGNAEDCHRSLPSSSRGTGGAMHERAGLTEKVRGVKNSVQRSVMPMREIYGTAAEETLSLRDDSSRRCSFVSFPSIFVPVQVQSHLRGVPRRLCELYLMTEEDLHGLFRGE